GRVTGPDGEPVVDASVRIPYPAALRGLEYGRATAPDGSFLLSFRHSLLGDGGIGFEIAKPGYKKRLVRLDPAEAFPAPLEVRLDPGLRLAGHVLGFDGESPTDMSVEARQGEDLFTSRVSRDGEYRFTSLTPGDWVVTTEDSGRTCGASRVTLEPGTKETVLDLQIPPAVEVRGKVFAPDGTPVDGVRLTFRSLDKEAPACASVFEMTTPYQGDGSFSTELPEGRFTVLANVEGYAPTVQATPLTIAARPVKDLEISLNPGRSLRGRLLGLRSEEAASASVKATNGSVSQETKAAADGSYRLDDLGPGDWSVSAVLGLEGSSRWLQTRVKLEPAQTEAVRDLDLLGELSFAARFASGDEPIALSMELSRSDSRGELVNTATLMNTDRYRFNRLPAGRYRLHIEDTGHHRKLERTIDLTSDQEITIDLLKPEGPWTSPSQRY
ncbi:MAG: carboxypeptidase-like regulatory domain-containing protein, partial [Thermoanaerobaculia bacterium]